MIKIHESYFFLIILLTVLISYIIFTIFKNCDINCKVNYYKYENYHTNDKKKNQNKITLNDLNNFYKESLINEDNMTSDEYLSKVLNVPN